MRDEKNKIHFYTESAMAFYVEASNFRNPLLWLSNIRCLMFSSCCPIFCLFRFICLLFG